MESFINKKYPNGLEYEFTLEESNAYIRAIKEYEEENDWISVTDKLPQDKEVVLAFDGTYPMVMIYDSKGKSPWDVWSEYGVYGYEYDVEIDYENIQYWKPIKLPTI